MAGASNSKPGIDADATPLTREEVIRKWREAYEREALSNVVSDVVYFT